MPGVGAALKQRHAAVERAGAQGGSGGEAEGNTTAVSPSLTGVKTNQRKYISLICYLNTISTFSLFHYFHLFTISTFHHFHLFTIST
jgi:hypothetical protein